MPTAQETTNKATFRHLTEAMNTGDRDLMSKAIDEAYAPDALIHTPMPVQATGSQAIKEVFGALYRAFPDLHIAVDDLIEEGDKMVARNTVTGTHRGEYMGVPPTGKLIKYNEMFVLRFVNGRIAETEGIVDVLSQMKQLGVFPPRPDPRDQKVVANTLDRSLNDAALNILFREARTFNKWQPRPVSDETLNALYELLKWGPTSANTTPARFAFVRSKEGKERLRPTLAPFNVEKTMAAPVTVIIAYDLRFYQHLPKLFPHVPGMAQQFESDPELSNVTAKRNSSLQGAYLIMAARALGLDCGPMSGFDQAKIDEAFFAGEPVKTNFVCNLGFGDPAGLFPRLPRLAFSEACSLL
jgi:3-hydroxypropanoate dehydrogenase